MQFKIKLESLPQKCDVCHQIDCFDPTNNYCSRCTDIKLEKTAVVEENIFAGLLSSIRIAIAALFCASSLTVFLSVIMAVIDPAGSQAADDLDPFGNPPDLFDYIPFIIFSFFLFVVGYMFLPNKKFLLFNKFNILAGVYEFGRNYYHRVLTRSRDN